MPRYPGTYKRKNKAGGWKNSTFVNTESMVRNYIVKVIGDLRMSEVTPEDIQPVINYLKRKKTSVYYSYNIISTTKKIFEVAMHWGYTDRNPAYTVPVQKFPRRKQPEADWIQVVRMIEKINSPRDEAIIGCGFFGLLRMGETFALEWSSVDFDQGRSASHSR